LLLEGTPGTSLALFTVESLATLNVLIHPSGKPIDVPDHVSSKEVSMIRYASFIALAALLTFGIGGTWSFAGEPAPSEQKEKKEMAGPKAGEEKKKDEKKEMGGR
jgi:H+/gluconate symporter-like permease